MTKITLIVVVGPTASGKSAYAIKKALETGGEIISGDSMQIYKKMDIGTAKPTPDEMNEIPHHLIDIADISEGCKTYIVWVYIGHYSFLLAYAFVPSHTILPFPLESPQ